jgi:hypothetical protein
VNRVGFETVVDNAFSSMGFSPEAAKYAYPNEMFLQGSDLSPIDQNIDKVIEGLTRWEPEIKKKTLVASPKILVEGEDYEDAVHNMNSLFLRNLWGDGLPIIPPTKVRVNRILKGTDLSPNSVVGEGRILPRGGIASVEMLAVCLAMAGGRPEYLPVLIAAVEALIHPLMTHQYWTSTTGSPTPLVIVNGSVVKQIRLNTGYGCLGPSPEFPAGASIGRAIRFVLMNLGGAVPGKGTMSLYGDPSRYANIILGEDEDVLPLGWNPFNVEQGFSRGSNSLTVDTIGLHGILCMVSATTEEEIMSELEEGARCISGTLNKPSRKTPCYVLIGQTAVQKLHKLGWSKKRVKTFLWDHARISAPLSRDLRRLVISMSRGEEPQFPLPISDSPEDIKIVVCGGAQSGHSYWFEAGILRESPISTGIKLPANWNQLLEEAERELGSLPKT